MLLDSVIMIIHDVRAGAYTVVPKSPKIVGTMQYNDAFYFFEFVHKRDNTYNFIEMTPNSWNCSQVKQIFQYQASLLKPRFTTEHFGYASLL